MLESLFIWKITIFFLELMAMKSAYGKDWLKTYLNVRLQSFNNHEDPYILMNG
jgi:hypothetical protein